MKIDLDVRQVDKLTRAVIRQLPFATANALNKTALTFQDVKRRDFRSTFLLRRKPFIEQQGVKVLKGFAKKDKLEITVGVDPHKADFLTKFEPGGTKRPRGEHLAIPSPKSLDRSKVIPRNMRPKALDIADGVAQGITVRRKKGTVTPGKIRRAGQGLRRTFEVPEVGIFQRRGRGAASTTHPLYLYGRQARIQPELRYIDRAREIMSRKFNDNFRAEFAKAIKTARV
jgi:hypothetical protein